MENFPHQSLTPIVGKPTPQTLQILKSEIIANAMSVPSARGGGEHGHLCLVLSADEMARHTEVPFEVPLHPGQPPVHPANTTNAMIHAADTAYTLHLSDAKEYNNTRNALRQLLLAAIEPEF